MRFDLLLTDDRRVRWLWWGILTYVGIDLALMALRYRASFWGLLFLPVGLSWIPLFYDKLFRQAARVLVAADSIAWANPADGPTICYQFAELRSYRFDGSKNASTLTLYPKEGEKAVLSGQIHPDFYRMQEALSRAIKSYNQANPSAEVAWESSALTKFFTNSLATRVGWVLLTLGATGIAWGINRDAPSAAYLPILFIGLPYLALWANFYYERA